MKIDTEFDACYPFHPRYRGTVEKDILREGRPQPQAIAEILPHASDFATYYQELRLTQPGWYGPNQKPAVMEPPPSQEWMKPKPRGR